MDMKTRWGFGPAVLLAVLTAAGCASPGRSRPDVDLSAPFPKGPAPGFILQMELVSTADIRWEGAAAGKQIRESRKTGLRIVALFEVTGRRGDTADIRVTHQSVGILSEGAFVPPPFLNFDPPRAVTFSVDYATRTVNFTDAEQIWKEWMERVRPTPAGDILAAGFDLPAWLGALRDLYASPALVLAGRPSSPAAVTIEEIPFTVPFLAPGLSLGPVQAELRTMVSGTRRVGCRTVTSIEGTLSSTRMGMSAPQLQARLRLFGLPSPPAFETGGTLSGSFTAEANRADGWARSSRSVFSARTLSRFAGGELVETVAGTNSAVSR
jgi:hypothetical protein